MTRFLSSILFAALYTLLVFGFDPSVWLESNFILKILLLIVGLIVGNLLSVIDSKYLHSFYGGVGKITQSIVFLGALFPVALFIVTSTGSELGIGLVIGFELVTTFSMLVDRRNLDHFSQKYLFQLARKLTAGEIRVVVGTQLLATVLLMLLVFI